MSRRETTAWAAAVAVSVGLHAALFLNSGARLGNPEAPAEKKHRATRVTLTSEAPAETAVPTPAQPQPKPQKREPEKKPPPRPEPERQPPPKPSPEPVERAPEAPVAPASSPTETESARAAESALPPAAVKGANRPDEDRLTEQEREAYLARLLAHIERHKRYPRVARRRGLEGRVEVSFLLVSDRGAKKLQTAGAHPLLSRAAEAAVRESVPLPAPPEGMALPLDVRFGMVFSLR